MRAMIVLYLSLFRSDVLDIKIIDINTFKDSICHKETKEAIIQQVVAEHQRIEILHPSNLEHLCHLRHVDD